jgi:hypothetical protein
MLWQTSSTSCEQQGRNVMLREFALLLLEFCACLAFVVGVGMFAIACGA